MPFSIPLYRHFPVVCSATYGVGPFHGQPASTGKVKCPNFHPT